MKTLIKAGAMLAIIAGLGLASTYAADAASACKSCKGCTQSCGSCQKCSGGNCTSCCK
jgi:hypothetical protein